MCPIYRAVCWDSIPADSTDSSLCSCSCLLETGTRSICCFLSSFEKLCKALLTFRMPRGQCVLPQGMGSLRQCISLGCHGMEMSCNSNRCNISVSLIKTPMKVPTESAVQRNTHINIWILNQDPEDIQTLGQYPTSVDYIELYSSFLLHQDKFIGNGALKGSHHTATWGKSHADSWNMDRNSTWCFCEGPG